MKENNVLGIVFANMHDEFIGELTAKRTTASVPFGGRYRLIDFTLSNMVNSGIEDIGVITKSNYQSLMDHLGSGRDWDLARKRGGLTILPPFSSSNSQGVYEGRLQALAGTLGYIRSSKAEYVVMADCEIVANLDLKDVLSQYIRTGADMTIVYKNGMIDTDSPKDVTLLDFDGENRLCDVRIDPTLSGIQKYSLDILVMKKSYLEKMITETAGRNLKSLRRDILMPHCKQLNIQGYEYKGYVAKINSMRSYFKANMALLNKDTLDNLFPEDRPIYTKVRDQVPAKYGLEAKVVNSLVADGCIIEGEVENSILFRGVKIRKGSKIKNSIVMQDSVIGENANLEYVITDKNVIIRDSRSLMGYETYPIYISKGSIV